jgi:hypothetical protein
MTDLEEVLDGPVLAARLPDAVEHVDGEEHAEKQRNHPEAARQQIHVSFVYRAFEVLRRHRNQDDNPPSRHLEASVIAHDQTLVCRTQSYGAPRWRPE